MPVNGDLITPPTTAAKPIKAQKPGPLSGNTRPSNAPSAAPIMNVGASTPPEVPEPSDKPQISDFTTRIPTINDSVADPPNRSAITS